MHRTIHPRAARPGFTLVELLVSAAVCVIIMSVLTVCFQSGTDTIRQMRSQGDMVDQLRAAGEVMKRDFQADHFSPVESVANVRNRGTRLSDYLFDQGATSASVRGGFFQITSPASTSEGADDSGFFSYRAANHAVWFTSVLPGGSEANLYNATVNGQVYTSQAAEVAYFLSAPVPANANGTPLYNLYRRQRLVALATSGGSSLKPALAGDPSGELISVTGGNVNTMADVTATGAKRPSFPGTLGGNRLGDDILLSNVISFEVKPAWSTSTATLKAATYPTNTDDPYDNLPATNTTFDTTANPVLGIRVNAVQIRVRIYDTKMRSARQVTYVFNL